MDTGTSGARDAVQRWRLVIARAAQPESQGQRDQLAAWDAALAGSGLPIAGLDAPRPKARFALAAPLASGVRGEAELADLWLVERLSRWRVREALSGRLPAGHTLVDLYDVWLGESPLPGRVAASVYRVIAVPPADPDALARSAAGLLAADTLQRERRKGEGTVNYDLRPFLAEIEVRAAGEGAEVRMTLLHDPARGIGRPEEVLAAIGETLPGPPPEWHDLVRVALVLAEPPPPEPQAARPARRPAPGTAGPGPQAEASRQHRGRSR